MKSNPLSYILLFFALTLNSITAVAQISDLADRMVEHKKNQESFNLHKSIKKQFRYNEIKALMSAETSKAVKKEGPRAYVNKHFFSLFPVEFEAAFLWDKNWGDSLLNGEELYISFYKNITDPTPIAVFKGGFSKGYADGYGCLIMPSPQPEGYYVKRGFWSKGKYVHEKETNATADYYAKTFAYTNAFGEGTVSNISSQVLSTNYNWDRIYEKYTNGRYLLDKVSFDFNGKPEWMLISIAFMDFYSNVDISFITASETMLRQLNRQFTSKITAAMSSQFSELVKTIVTTGGASYFDELTAVRKDPWNTYSYIKCYNMNVATEYGFEEDAYVNSGSRTIYIYTRKQKTGDWKLVPAEWTITKRANCDATVFYTNTKNGTKNGIFFRTGFATEEDAIRDVVKEARTIEPYEQSPQNTSEPVLNLSIKRDLLMKRVADIDLLKFNNRDSLIGAWLCRATDRIYVIFPGYMGEGRNLVYLPLGDDYIGHEDGYLIDAHGVKWTISDKFRGYSKGEWYKEYGHLKFSSDYFNTYKIKELRKDTIAFQQWNSDGKLVEGDTWERVTPTTSY